MFAWTASGLLIFSTAVAQPPESPNRPDAAAVFTRWDRNGDGQLSEAEVPTQIRGNFRRIDADKNGSISREEHAAAYQRAGGMGERRGDNPAAANVEVLPNLPYAGNDNPRQQVNLLLPKERNSDKPLPVLVFIHGGAWRGGDRAQAMSNLMPYVAEGTVAGVSVGYRLSGEAQWPNQIHDCKAAIRWIYANAEKYQLDTNRIVVWGSSAGGHLVLMLGLTNDVSELDGSIGPHTAYPSKVSGVINFFGPTDMLTMGEGESNIAHNSPNAPEALLLGGAIPENKERAKEASPTTYVSAGDPPILTIHGTADPVVPYGQAEILHKKLAEAGVPNTFVTVVGGGHGFRAPQVPERVKQFVQKHLLGEDVTVSAEPIPAAVRPPQREQ